MPRWRPYYSFDLAATGNLPADWVDQIDRLSLSRGVMTALGGANSTSLERRSSNPVSVTVVEGTAIQAALPWLWSAYRNELMEFSAASFGRQLFPANQAVSAVNINRLEGVGSRYEWHMDTNPVTGLLFASTCRRGDGGALVFRDPESSRNAIVRPQAGTFICFDARAIPHRVAPLRTQMVRLSVPMNYYESAESQPRPDDLDEYLYDAALANTSGADKFLNR